MWRGWPGTASCRWFHDGRVDCPRAIVEESPRPTVPLLPLSNWSGHVTPIQQLALPKLQQVKRRIVCLKPNLNYTSVKRMAHFETFGNLGSGSGWVKDVDSNSSVKITRIFLKSIIFGH